MRNCTELNLCTQDLNCVWGQRCWTSIDWVCIVACVLHMCGPLSKTWIWKLETSECESRYKGLWRTFIGIELWLGMEVLNLNWVGLVSSVVCTSSKRDIWMQLSDSHTVPLDWIPPGSQNKLKHQWITCQETHLLAWEFGLEILEGCS